MKILIRKICSPSIVTDVKEFATTELLVTWGGGMGGANKTYYAVKQNGNEWTMVNGEVIELNPDFIVHKKKATVVKVVTDRTAYSNYGSDKKKYAFTETTEYHLIPFGYTYEISQNPLANTNSSSIGYLTERKEIKV